MKFIHIADVHIGARPDAAFPWGIQREKEILSSFNRMIDSCNEKQIDLLLIAGDLFHRQPLIRELKEINYCFEKLNNTQVVMIAGNHDYIGVRSHYIDFSWAKHVHLLKEEELDSIYLEEINTEVYGFSYHTRDITEARYDKVYPGCEERINILLAHAGDEKNVPIDKKKVQQNGFDYIALGHIHKPEILGERMAYSGSLEPLDKNENGERGYILGEIEKTNDTSSIQISFVPSAVRQYYKLELLVTPRTTNGALQDQVKSKIQEYGMEHIYSLDLTGLRDADILFSKEDLLEFGNVIEVEDQTIPDYDFDALYQENQDNIIGLFIKRIREEAEQDTIAQKALYFGIEALLGAKQ